MISKESVFLSKMQNQEMKETWTIKMMIFFLSHQSLFSKKNDDIRRDRHFESNFENSLISQSKE
jgi:hypothetical protein